MGPAPYSPLGIALFAIPLYSGPVLAGLSNGPRAVIPVFGALFLLYLVMTRKPASTPGTHAAQIALWGVVQVGLAAVCMALGSGLSKLTGPLPLPVWVPLTLTALASLYGSYRYRHAPEMDALLDTALDSLTTAAPFPETHPQPNQTIFDWIDAYCLAPSPQDRRATLDKLARHPSQQAVAKVLLDSLYSSESALELTLAYYTQPDIDLTHLDIDALDSIIDETVTYSMPSLARLALSLGARKPGCLSQDTRNTLEKQANPSHTKEDP